MNWGGQFSKELNLKEFAYKQARNNIMQAVYHELKHRPFCEEYQWVVSEQYCCYYVHYACLIYDRRRYQHFETTASDLRESQAGRRHK